MSQTFHLAFDMRTFPTFPTSPSPVPSPKSLPSDSDSAQQVSLPLAQPTPLRAEGPPSWLYATEHISSQAYWRQDNIRSPFREGIESLSVLQRSYTVLQLMSENEDPEESSFDDPPPPGISDSSSEEDMYEEDSSYRSLSPVPIVNVGSPCTENTSPVPSPQRTPSPTPPPAYTGAPPPNERDELMQIFVNFSLAHIIEARRMREELQASSTRNQAMLELIEMQRLLIQHMEGRQEDLGNLLNEAIMERGEMEYFAQVTEGTDIPAVPYSNAGSTLDPVFIAKLILEALKTSLYISVALLIVVPTMRPLLPSVLAAAFVLLVVVWLLQSFATDEMQQAQT